VHKSQINFARSDWLFQIQFFIETPDLGVLVLFVRGQAVLYNVMHGMLALQDAGIIVQLHL